jgi:hypothetical protein
MIFDLQRVVRDFSPEQNPIRLRFGVVQSVGSGVLTVTVAGSDVEISGVRFLSSYSASASDTVAMLTDGLDLLVLGKVS